MLKPLLLSVFVAANAYAGAPAGAPKHPIPFWFFEATYADGRIMTYPVQMDDFIMALPYNGRILHAELPQLISAKHHVGKNILRRFTAQRGDDVLSGEVLCDLSQFEKQDVPAGQHILKFSGGNPASSPKQIRFYCQF